MLLVHQLKDTTSFDHEDHSCLKSSSSHATDVQSMVGAAVVLPEYAAAVTHQTFRDEDMFGTSPSDTLIPTLVHSPVTNVRSYSLHLSTEEERDDISNHTLSSFHLHTHRRENLSRMPSFESMPPNMVPIDQPTCNDILFGRGGLTNHHPGNKRFRDVVALHKDEYAEASKVSKPLVARKIVKAIRNADPPGRFLMRNTYDSKWYDVGDRRAAEKASQALREKSQEEKKSKSVDDDIVQGNQYIYPFGAPTFFPTQGNQDLSFHSHAQVVGLPSLPDAESAFTFPDTNLMAHNLSLYSVSPFDTNISATTPMASMQVSVDDIRSPQVEEPMFLHDDSLQEQQQLHHHHIRDQVVGLTDQNGNIVVTDYDILCGRGGATNHHKGNKRFRDVVALHRQDYVRASKTQKPNVSRHIVHVIRTNENPGRFLKKGDDGHWYDIGDQRAAEKVSQALREKSLDERTESSDSTSMGHLTITSESLDGQPQESFFHPPSYHTLQPEAYQFSNAMDQDNSELLMANTSSQPVSPITLTHLSSAIDDGHLTEDNVHAI